MEEIRLNKYLSEMGICSRREADRLIEAGKVLVDGQTAPMRWKNGRYGGKWTPKEAKASASDGQ